MEPATQEFTDVSCRTKILNRIYAINGQKIILDEDLAEMYGVETKRLNEQVKRNIKRFPKDFMFTLTPKNRKTRSRKMRLQAGEVEEIKGNSKDIENIFMVLKELLEKS